MKVLKCKPSVAQAFDMDSLSLQTLTNSTISIFSFIVPRAGIEPARPLLAKGFSTGFLLPDYLFTIFKFELRYLVYSLYTFMNYYLQFSSGLFTFILQGCNLPRISQVLHQLFPTGHSFLNLKPTINHRDFY